MCIFECRTKSTKVKVDEGGVEGCQGAFSRGKEIESEAKRENWLTDCLPKYEQHSNDNQLIAGKATSLLFGEGEALIPFFFLSGTNWDCPISEITHNMRTKYGRAALE